MQTKRPLGRANHGCRRSHVERNIRAAHTLPSCVYTTLMCYPEVLVWLRLTCRPTTRLNAQRLSVHDPAHPMDDLETLQ